MRFEPSFRVALSRPLQVERFMGELIVVLPEGHRGTVTDDAPDRFNYNQKACTPVQFDVGGEVIWVWDFCLRGLEVLETLSEV
jgi:hypothetical protein